MVEGVIDGVELMGRTMVGQDEEVNAICGWDQGVGSMVLEEARVLWQTLGFQQSGSWG